MANFSSFAGSPDDSRVIEPWSIRARSRRFGKPPVSNYACPFLAYGGWTFIVGLTLLVAAAWPPSPARFPLSSRAGSLAASAEHALQDEEVRNLINITLIPALPPLATRAEVVRRAKIAHCLAVYFDRPVDADRLRPWSIMHGLIAYQRDAEIVVGGERVNAAEYLCGNGVGNGMRILTFDKGKLRGRIGPGVQGHPGQLLAILAQSGVPAHHWLFVDGQNLTLQDLIAAEQLDCRSRTELTFRLIAFAHYLEPTAQWVNEQGDKWSMARLVSEECQQPIEAGACGGTHRLMALSYALRQLERHGIPVSGPWLQAERIVGAYQERAWRHQNPNGSFSTQFFHGSGRDADLMRRVYTTGHILEWLAYSLPPESLNDVRLTRAVDYLVDTLLTAPGGHVDVGPRGHALHALLMYYQRAYELPMDIKALRVVAESVPESEWSSGLATHAAAPSSEARQADSQRAPSRPAQQSPARPLFRRR